jgi:uncharacterized protein YndB with AHSA1/START domain
MATARGHIRIDRPAADVWQAIADPTLIKDWFPGLSDCTADGSGVRHVTTSNGREVDEEIVTNDASLRRFQYRLLPGAVPVEQHLATVDVIEDGNGSLVVYGVDVQPEAFGPAMQQTVDAALAGLKAHVEG